MTAPHPARRWRATPFSSGSEYSTGGHRNGACIRAEFDGNEWYWRVTTWTKLDADVQRRGRFSTSAAARRSAERWLSKHTGRRAK